MQDPDETLEVEICAYREMTLVQLYDQCCPEGNTTLLGMPCNKQTRGHVVKKMAEVIGLDEKYWQCSVPILVLRPINDLENGKQYHTRDQDRHSFKICGE